MPAATDDASSEPKLPTAKRRPGPSRNWPLSQNMLQLTATASSSSAPTTLPRTTSGVPSRGATRVAAESAPKRPATAATAAASSPHSKARRQILAQDGRRGSPRMLRGARPCSTACPSASVSQRAPRNGRRRRIGASVIPTTDPRGSGSLLCRHGPGVMEVQDHPLVVLRPPVDRRHDAALGADVRNVRDERRVALDPDRFPSGNRTAGTVIRLEPLVQLLEDVLVPADDLLVADDQGDVGIQQPLDRRKVAFVAGVMEGLDGVADHLPALRVGERNGTFLGAGSQENHGGRGKKSHGNQL